MAGNPRPSGHALPEWHGCSERRHGRRSVLGSEAEPGMTPDAVRAIEIEGLCVGYGATPALEDITLAVRQHETLGLLGRHGAGKTSLLKAILMLVTPQAGSVRIFGEPHHAPAQSRAGLSSGALPAAGRPPGP